jgi:hypothetical protein
MRRYNACLVYEFISERERKRREERGGGERGERKKLRVKEADAKWRQRCQAFLLLSVNSWAQMRKRSFYKK